MSFLLDFIIHLVLRLWLDDDYSKVRVGGNLANKENIKRARIETVITLEIIVVKVKFGEILQSAVRPKFWCSFVTFFFTQKKKKKKKKKKRRSWKNVIAKFMKKEGWFFQDYTYTLQYNTYVQEPSSRILTTKCRWRALRAESFFVFVTSLTRLLSVVVNVVFVVVVVVGAGERISFAVSLPFDLNSFEWTRGYCQSFRAVIQFRCTGAKKSRWHYNTTSLKTFLEPFIDLSSSILRKFDFLTI